MPLCKTNDILSAIIYLTIQAQSLQRPIQQYTLQARYCQPRSETMALGHGRREQPATHLRKPQVFSFQTF